MKKLVGRPKGGHKAEGFGMGDWLALVWKVCFAKNLTAFGSSGSGPMFLSNDPALHSYPRSSISSTF
jgi:hypothetical protein